MADVTTGDITWTRDSSFPPEVNALIATHGDYLLTVVPVHDGKSVAWEILRDGALIEWSDAPDREAAKTAAIAALEAELRNLIAPPLKIILPEM